MKKLLIFLSVIIMLLPIRSYANERRIELSENEISTIVNSTLSEIIDKRIDLIIRADNPEEEALLVLLSSGIKFSSIEYVFERATKEVLIELFKMGKKIFSLSSGTSLVKLGTDELKRELIDWLVKDELRVGAGVVKVYRYRTLGGGLADAEFPFLILHNPKDNKTEITFYLKEKAQPPDSVGSITGYNAQGGSFWNSDNWSKDAIDPALVRISGETKRSSYGGIFWKESLIEIELNTSSDIEFRDLSAVERKIISVEKKLIAAQNAYNLIKNSLSQVAQKIWSKLSKMTQATIASFFYSNDGKETTLVSLKDEIQTFKNVVEKEPVKYQDLEEIISDVEIELDELSLIPTEKEEKIERVEINSALKEDLTKIIHIGSVRADEIIRLRPFKSLDDLIRVPGIGEKILSDIKEEGIAYVIYNETEENDEKDEKEKKEKESNPCDSGKLDLNRASQEDLKFIVGIGDVIAQRIIDYRKSTPFRSLNDLTNVKGIGPSVLQKILDQNCAYVEYDQKDDRSNDDANTSRLSLSRSNLSFLWEMGEILPKKEIVMIKNDGSSPLSIEFIADSWIKIDKITINLLPKESASLGISVNPSDLETGEYQADIIIKADNLSEIIAVNLTVTPPLIEASSLIISEVGINEAEFVELYNPSDKEVDLSGWYLVYYSSKREWNNPYRSWRFPDKSIIESESYFLIGVYDYPEESGFPNSDWDVKNYSSGQLSDISGSIAILSCDPKDKYLDEIEVCQVDALGWGDTLVFKGEPAESPDKNMSLSRRKNQALNYINIQDNKIDFIQSSPTPTNSKGETNDLFPPEPIDDLSVDCQEGRAVLRWTARSDRDTPQDLLRYEISYFKENSLDGVTHQHSVSSEGEQEEFIIDNLNYDTDYRFMIEVLDRINRSLPSNIISAKTDPINYEKTWPLFRGNPNRSGKMSSPTRASQDFNLNLLIEGESQADFVFAPIIDFDGSLYFKGELTINGLKKEGVFSFDNKGELRWFFDGKINRLSNPVMIRDGSVIVLSYDKDTTVNLINRDGTTEWQETLKNCYPTGEILTDGDIAHIPFSYLDGLSGKIVSFDMKKKKLLWEIEFNQKIVDKTMAKTEDGILIAVDDTLYLFSFEGDLIQKRRFPLIDGDNLGSYLLDPVVYQDYIYILVKDEKALSTGKYDALYKIDKDFQVSWKMEDLFGTSRPPTIDYNGDLILFNFSDSVYRNVSILRYDNDAQFIKSIDFSLVSEITDMIVDCDNNIYGIFGNDLRGFNQFGDEIFTISFDTLREKALSMDGDGALYLAGKRSVYKID